MEKPTPHYDLRRLQELASRPETRFVSLRAQKDAFKCGYAHDREIIREIRTLRHTDFHKSMTSDWDHTLWQDVYKVSRHHPLRPDQEQRLYIKLQESKDGKAVVISFHPADT
jgi:motility quorum-sensing regulator/GCU-specific mRNA interferase toxin